MLAKLLDPEFLKYLASFSFGVIIIALFSSRRLEQLTSFPPGEEFQIVRLISTRTFSGRKPYRRALIYYLLLLEFIFVLFCTIEPIAIALGGPAVQKQFQFNNVSWPLGAALVVVGLLPATPLIEQIELAFRRFAQRAAGIPASFLSSVGRLEQSQLENDILANRNEYSTEIERYFRTQNILVASGFSIGEAEYFARSELFVSAFNNWTLAPQASKIWSSAARSHFDETKASISSRIKRLRADLDRLMDFSLETKYIRALRDELGVKEWIDQLDLNSIRNSTVFDTEEKKARKDLAERWEPATNELSVVSKQLLAIFVVLTANDEAPNTEDDAALKKAIRLARRDEAKPFYNTALASIISGFASSFFAVTIMSALFHWYAGLAVTDLVKGAVSEGAITSAPVTVQFGVALMVAIAIRYARIVSSRYEKWEPKTVYPLGQSAIILLYSAICAAAVNIMIYVIYQYFADNLNAQEALNRNALPSDIAFKLVWSLVAALFSIGCVAVADFVEKGKKGWWPSLLAFTGTALAAFVFLILSGNYEIASRPFWANMVAVVSFSVAGLLVFRATAISSRQH